MCHLCMEPSDPFVRKVHHYILVSDEFAFSALRIGHKETEEPM